MAKTSIANSESGSSVRTKLNASDIRPEAILINIDESGDQTIDCGLGVRLHDTITANRTIGTISNLTLATILDIEGAFTVDFSAALKADTNNTFIGNDNLIAGDNYISIVPKEAGGIVVTYLSRVGESVSKAAGAALGSTITWTDGTFQPKTTTVAAFNITTISNQGLGTVVLSIGANATDVTIDAALITAERISGSFDNTLTTNYLKIVCYDAVTPEYYASWETSPIVAGAAAIPRAYFTKTAATAALPLAGAKTTIGTWATSAEWNDTSNLMSFNTTSGVLTLGIGVWKVSYKVNINYISNAVRHYGYVDMLEDGTTIIDTSGGYMRSAVQNFTQDGFAYITVTSGTKTIELQGYVSSVTATTTIDDVKMDVQKVD